MTNHLKDAYILTLKRQELDYKIKEYQIQWREIAKKVRILGQERYKLQTSIDSVILKFKDKETKRYKYQK